MSRSLCLVSQPLHQNIAHILTDLSVRTANAEFVESKSAEYNRQRRLYSECGLGVLLGTRTTRVPGSRIYRYYLISGS